MPWPLRTVVGEVFPCHTHIFHHNRRARLREQTPQVEVSTQTYEVGLFVVGLGGATQCGSRFCVANLSHACWSQRQAALAVCSLSPSSMSHASAFHMVSTAQNVCIGSWLMKLIAIQSGTHVFATHNVTHGSLLPDTPSVFGLECTHAWV